VEVGGATYDKIRGERIGGAEHQDRVAHHQILPYQ